MSSIYDALQRLQQASNSSEPALPLCSKSRPRLTPGLVVALGLIAVVVLGLVIVVIVKFVGAEPAAVVQPVAPPPAVRPLSPAPPVIEDPALLLAEARRLKGQGDSKAARDYYNRLLDKGSAPLEAYFELGALQFKSGNLDEALVVYDKGLAAHRDDPRLLNNMGTILLEKGETVSAVGYFEQAQTRAPDFVEPVYNLACAYARLGESAKAVNYLKKACAMHPDVSAWAAGDADLRTLAGNAEFDALVERQ